MPAPHPPAPEAFTLAPGAGMPNHPTLPVLVYRGAVPADAGGIEATFDACGWGGTWRDGIFDFDHFHSRGHEALGIAAGRARVLLGGSGGREVEVEAGDVLVLPAGTGHRRLDAATDLLVVGAYPPGQTGDICRGPASEADRARIAALPLPESDPVAGHDGPLTRLWQGA